MSQTSSKEAGTTTLAPSPPAREASRYPHSSLHWLQRPVERQSSLTEDLEAIDVPRQPHRSARSEAKKRAFQRKFGRQSLYACLENRHALSILGHGCGKHSVTKQRSKGRKLCRRYTFRQGSGSIAAGGPVAEWFTQKPCKVFQPGSIPGRASNSHRLQNTEPWAKLRRYHDNGAEPRAKRAPRPGWSSGKRVSPHQKRSRTPERVSDSWQNCGFTSCL